MAGARGRPSGTQKMHPLANHGSMPRPHRVDYPGAIHHVGTRGNYESPIVFDDEDRQRLIAIVARACARYEIDCGAWCLMTTHYHLILRSRTARLSSAMAWINGRFACWINARHGRSGHLFGARFFNRVLETDGYRREVARYLPLNPVRAGLVAQPEGWKWSSYASELGSTPRPEFLSRFIVDDWFDGRPAAYRAWVAAAGSTPEDCLAALLEAYPRFDAIRMALDAHHMSLEDVARCLGMHPLDLRNEIRATR